MAHTKTKIKRYPNILPWHPLLRSGKWNLATEGTAAFPWRGHELWVKRVTAPQYCVATPCRRSQCAVFSLTATQLSTAKTTVTNTYTGGYWYNGVYYYPITNPPDVFYYALGQGIPCNKYNNNSLIPPPATAGINTVMVSDDYSIAAAEVTVPAGTTGTTLPDCQEVSETPSLYFTEFASCKMKTRVSVTRRPRGNIYGMRPAMAFVYVGA